MAVALVWDPRGKVRAELEQLAAAEQLPAGIRWRRHWDSRAAALEVWGKTAAAEEWAIELEQRHGGRYWYEGAWRTRRFQLRLPGL